MVQARKPYLSTHRNVWRLSGSEQPIWFLLTAPFSHIGHPSLGQGTKPPDWSFDRYPSPWQSGVMWATHTITGDHRNRAYGEPKQQRPSVALQKTQSTTGELWLPLSESYVVSFRPVSYAISASCCGMITGMGPSTAIDVHAAAIATGKRRDKGGGSGHVSMSRRVAKGVIATAPNARGLTSRLMSVSVAVVP